MEDPISTSCSCRFFFSSPDLAVGQRINDAWNWLVLPLQIRVRDVITIGRARRTMQAQLGILDWLQAHDVYLESLSVALMNLLPSSIRRLPGPAHQATTI